MQKPKNGVANALAWIGILTYIGAFIGGLAISESGLLVTWVAGFISGTIFIGFAEIIKQLTRIASYTEMIQSTNLRLEENTQALERFSKSA
ncbi:MAG: hypothetical protein FWF85_05935 [Clostridiales bacterium]|nr:hypothetical protein [Clostridiales bacterium]